MTRQSKIRSLERQLVALRKEGRGSGDPECRRLSSLLAYHRNPATRKKYLKSLDPLDEAFKRRVRYVENREGVLAYNKAWRDANLDKARASVRAYRRNNPNAKIADRLRSMLRHVLATTPAVPLSGRPRGRKPRLFIKLAGCAPAEFRAHVERQFVEGMTWENRGTAWEIDHIQPLSGFDLTQEAQQKLACHFTNVRLLSREANLAKGWRPTPA